MNRARRLKKDSRRVWLPMKSSLDRQAVERAKELASARAEEIMRLAQRLVQTPSDSGEEGDAARLVVQALTAAGFDRVIVDPAGNVAGWMTGESEHPLLMYNCHLDHVNLNARSMLWDHPPFAGALVDGRLNGLGAADTKGALAAQIVGATILRDLNPDLKGSLCVSAVIAEEITTFGMDYLLDHTCRPDFVVLGEASDLGVRLGHRGSFGVTIEVLGLPCHASAPWRGINAIDVAKELLTAAAELNAVLPRDDALGAATLTPLGIRSEPYDGGVLPDRCLVLLKRRLVRGESYESAMEEIGDVVGALGDRFPGAEVRVLQSSTTARTYTGLEYEPVRGEFAHPWLLDATHPLVGAAVDAIEQITGQVPTVGCWDFSTHGVSTYARRGIPTIGFAPGREDSTHTPRDHVTTEQLVSAAAIYAVLAGMVLT